jgi:phosphate transport system substrate-binding protein
MLRSLRGSHYRQVVLVTVVAILGVACADTSTTPTSGSNGGGDLSGSIVVSGSSTVEPISVAVAEKYIAENPDVEVRVDGPGTSDGFELFCNGETDISDASRPIEAEEIKACKQNGIDFIELKVGIDGLSVITSTENDEVGCLSFADLYALLGPESEGFDNWSDANHLAQELDAPFAPYPDAPLEITAPGEESGTFDSFVELVLEGIAEERNVAEEQWAPRKDYQASANDNVIIEGIGGTPSSLGWVGYAFYTNNQETVKALEVAEGNSENCVAPTTETIQSGDYPIARDLFIYVKEDSADSEAVGSYVDYYLSEEGIASVSEVGYVDLAPKDLEETRQTWEEKQTGTTQT